MPKYHQELDAKEIEFATKLGRARNENARRMGGKNKHGLESDPGDEVSINGVAGELAFRKWSGLKVELTIDTFKARPDFLQDIEIRTLGRSHYDLWVRDDDNLSYRFVLLTGRLPNTVFTIHGWQFGHEVKSHNVRKHFAGREPVWTLPQDLLLDAKTLPGLPPRPEEPETPLPGKLAPSALCGSYACGGCYDISDGKSIHPPRAGYDQARLIRKD